MREKYAWQEANGAKEKHDNMVSLAWAIPASASN
jgi:hypothetical protein